MRSAKCRGKVKIKIGERPVLFLTVKTTMRSAKCRGKTKLKICGSLVLILTVKTTMRSAKCRKRSKSKLASVLCCFNGEIGNAVGEVPGKDQIKNWRASCAVFNGENDNAFGEVPGKGQNKNWRASCAVFNGENDTAALCAEHFISPTRASPHPGSKHMKLKLSCGCP